MMWSLPHVLDHFAGELGAFDFLGAFHLAGEVVGDGLGTDRAVEALENQVSGFGLIQPLGPLDVPSLERGSASSLAIGDKVIVVGHGGERHSLEAQLIARREFAGYWEYLLENAIFTSPAHPFWSGAALIGRDGKLLGTGSLILQQGDGKQRMDMNMIVPIAYLKPVLEQLLAHGRQPQPPRPWLGLYALENDGELVVGGVSDRGPAAQAGVQQGDRILGIGDEEVTELGALWRKLWASGPAGSPVLLRLSRDGKAMAVRMTSTDRTSLFRAPRLH